MASTTEDTSLAKSEEKEAIDSESTSLAKGKQIITHTETTDLLGLNPTDIDQSIYVKVYRKWTTINKASVPSMYSCILIDQQVQSYIQAKT
jgi:hypothetical protein